MLYLSLRAIIGLTLVTVAAIGAGAWIPWILPHNFRRFERAAFIVLGGFGLLSTALFLVGQVSFTRSSISSFLAVTAAFGVVAIFPGSSPGLSFVSVTTR